LSWVKTFQKKGETPMAQHTNNSTEQWTEVGRGAKQNMQNLVSDLKTVFQDSASELKTVAQETKDRLVTKGRETGGKLDRYVRANPWPFVGSALAAGFLIGLRLRGKR
jgi:ElaB/YqjD/DUF883 family membrane-anchored ribosome-binding protein